MNPNVPKKFTPATLALWLEYDFHLDGVFGKAKWCWNHPICEEPSCFEPKVWFTRGAKYLYNGHDRLGIQLDDDLNLHIVYAYDDSPNENRAVRVKCSRDLIFGLPRDKVELLIPQLVMKAFKAGLKQ